MIFKHLFFSILLSSSSLLAQSYAPAAGQIGSTAFHKDSSAFKSWATGITTHRGYIQISDTTKYHEGSNRATFGANSNALGKPTGITTDAISLGDGGWAIVTFDAPISNGPSWDFAVFENGHSDNYLELAFVEVSSDGLNYFRFPAHTEIPSDTQIDGFGTIDCRYINNFAGKYRVGYGTPFDLNELPDTSLLDKNNIRFVKIIDVVGSINPLYASYDYFGNVVNDPFPTPFFSSGFDLTGVGIINSSDTTLTNMQLKSDAFWTVYPNVFDQEIHISSQISSAYTLLSIDGKQISTGKLLIGETTLTTSDLLSGMYFLNLSNGKNTKTIRLIKR
jgi:hypothetical protein